MKLLSYSNWDCRPAALFEAPSGEMFALAQLEPGARWVPVDADDVFESAGLLSREPSEAVLRREFGWSIGDAEVPSEANFTSFMPSLAAD